MQSVHQVVEGTIKGRRVQILILVYTIQSQIVLGRVFCAIGGYSHDASMEAPVWLGNELVIVLVSNGRKELVEKLHRTWRREETRGR